MNAEKFIFAGLLFGLLFTIVLFFTICYQYKSNKVENEKDEFIFVEVNSLGCEKYRYNESIVWKCPKGLEVNSFESTHCSGGKYNHCTTKREPAI